MGRSSPSSDAIVALYREEDDRGGGIQRAFPGKIAKRPAPRPGPLRFAHDARGGNQYDEVSPIMAGSIHACAARPPFPGGGRRPTVGYGMPEGRAPPSSGVQGGGSNGDRAGRRWGVSS